MMSARLVFLLVSAVSVALAEDVPESIRTGQPAFRVNGEVRYHVTSPSDPTKRIPFPEAIWREVGRGVLRPAADFLTAQRMFKEGTWVSFVRQSVASIEDVIIGEYAAIPGHEVCTELEPIPTKDQEAWCRGLVDRWLIPLPEGFVQAGLGGGDIATWNRWKWGNSSKIRVTRGAVPKKGTGGPIERVYWFDRPMSAEAMLIEVAAENEYLKFRRDLGGTVAIMRVVDPDERIQVSWPSGQFLVRLNLPKEMYRTTAKAYLERYPSSWPEKIDYDPQRLMLRVLDEAIVEMTKHVDGPLEFLRYSFKTYPFDDACRRAWNILPDNDLDRQHKDAIKAIHEDWAKTPADKIKLSDYHDAMLAYRRDLIAKITAERERIAKEGVERKEK